MFKLERTLLLARAAFMHGYITEAKTLYLKLLKLQPNHSVRDFQLLAYIQNLGEDQIVSSIIFAFLI